MSTEAGAAPDAILRDETPDLDRLVPLVYDELRRLAGRYLRAERGGHTLQPTALVHEAFLRLLDQKRVMWQNRAHVFRMAAQMMRRVLVDSSRRHYAKKRGSHGVRLTLAEGAAVEEPRAVDLLDLDRALTKLAALDERQAEVVELRFFAGLGVEEVAELLAISTATVKREWALARAWLLVELRSGAAGDQEPVDGD